MTAQGEKIQAYYHWLRERGQAYPDGRAPLVRPQALAFIGDGTFTAEERGLLVKIAAALGLAEGDVSFNKCQSPRVIVFLGRNTRGPSGEQPHLVIDHPRDLIKNPQLKRQAWADLQRIKQLLV